MYSLNNQKLTWNHLMVALLIIAAMFSPLLGKAQNKLTPMPDCGTGFYNSPCKIAVKGGYIVKNYNFETASTASTATISSYTFSAMGTYHVSPKFKGSYYYVYFSYGHWGTSQPDSTGKVTLYIKKKYLKFINDSTAVYTPLKQ